MTPIGSAYCPKHEASEAVEGVSDAEPFPVVSKPRKFDPPLPTGRVACKVSARLVCGTAVTFIGSERWRLR